MRLTIIYPCVGRIPGEEYIRSWQMEPLAVAYLSALIPKDIEVRFYDDRMEPISYDEKTDLVVIPVETYTAKRAYQIASEYRSRGVKVVMGGYHATLVPDEVLEYADSIVVGEGEESFPLLIEDFRMSQMKRIYYSFGSSEIQDISPDRSIFSGKRYLDISLIEATRGCRSRCEFCSITTFHKGRHSHRRMGMLLKEVDILRVSKNLFFFVDDNFTADVKFAKEFCRALVPLRIKWVGQASITSARDQELMALMRASGCQGVLVGFESLNIQNLKAMNKQFNYMNIDFKTAIKRFNEHHLRLYATFVFGYDHDTLEDFSRTLDFCVHNKIFMAAFNPLTPFPGTSLYTKLEREGRLLYKKWWLDDRYRYGDVPFRTVIPPDVITRECIKARKEFYNIPSIYRRMFARSNCSNLFMLNAYWFINLLLRKEADQRVNYPLGDQSFQKNLLKVNVEGKEDAFVSTA